MNLGVVIITYKKQEIIKYPRWLKKNCPECNNHWLEIWAFVWIENNKEQASPIGVCPRCDEIIDLSKESF